MKAISDFFSNLFKTDSWPARWRCGEWTDFHGWLYIISDVMIGLAYFAIPCLIVYYVTRKNNKLPFLPIFWLFGAFILACGSGHFINAAIFWWPAYRVSALVNFATALISWATVFAVVRTLPKAFTLRTTADLETEVEQRKLVEAELQARYNELEDAQQIAKLGSYRWDIKNDTVTWTNQLYRNMGLKPGTAVNLQKYMSAIVPEEQEMVMNMVQEALKTGQNYNFVHHVKTLDTGELRIMSCRGEVVKDADGTPKFVLGTAQDVTQQKQTELSLAQKAKDLEQSNSELEMFAYAASHDLQEPLRKIRSFGDRLSERFSDQLGEVGKDYLVRMDSASARMQKLIEDLLNFSRLSRSHDGFAVTNLNQVFKDVLTDLEYTIHERGATIRVDQLPEVEVIPSQMRQLFQNMVTNALKFSKKDVKPEIMVTAELTDEPDNHSLGAIEKKQYCRLIISDNGIGFDEKYTDRIFVLFQRLHGKADYEGTGIGLALVKKIVDNHAGHITATSRVNEGATFIITLPVKHVKVFVKTTPDAVLIE